MSTNIHHPSYYFRRTAIAAIVAGVLSPSASASIAGQNAGDDFATLTGTAGITPTGSIVAVNSGNITLATSPTGNITNANGVLTSAPASSIVLDVGTGNISSVAASGATNAMSVTSGGSVTVSSTAVNITAANIDLNGVITDITATNGNITNLVTSNLSATGGSATGLTNINATNGNINNLVTSNLSATGGNATGLTNINATNGSINNLATLNLSATGGSATGLTNINATNGNINHLVTSNLSATGGSATGLTNVNAINGNFTNLATSNLSATGGDATGLTNINATNGNITNLIGTNGNINNLATSNLSATGGNATGLTNVNATNGNITNLIGTNGNINNLATSNLSATGGNATGLTNVNATNGNITNLIGTNGNITNLSATMLNVNGQTTMAGINNSGPLNNVGNLTNVGNTTLTGASNKISTVNGGSLTTNVTGATLTGNNVSGQGLALNNNGSIALTGASAAGLTVNAAGTGVTLLNNVGAGHGLNITATGTTLSGGTNSSSLTLNNNNAVIAVGTATTPEVNVITASNTNGNTSFTLNSNGTTTATSVLAAATQGTSGNISSFTRDGITVPRTTNQGGVLGTTVSESASSVLLTNGRGGTNGLQVFENRTNIAGDTINMMGNTTLGNITFGPNSSANFTGVNVTGLDVNVTLTQIRGAAEPFASNGVNGTASLLDTNTGAGAMTTFKSTSVQTVAANTTIGNQLAGAKYQSLVNGNQLIDGNLYVNGDTAFVGTNSATSTVVGKRSSSKLAGATTGIVGKTGITTGTPVTDIVTGATATESVASVTLTNGNGQTGGLQVFEDRTSLSGGTNATTQVASNGVSGTPAGQAPVGSGAITVYNARNVQSVAPNTTIGDRLNGAQYQGKINGNTLVDGNLYVNGDTKFVGNTAATSTVVGGAGTSKFNPAASVSGQTGIQTSTATNPVPVTDIATGKTASESVASTTLTNGAGKTNGLQVFEDRTNLTGGGQQSSSLTLNDNGATFSAPNGAPAKVTGVADGTSKYDAVNFGQLQDLSSDLGNVAERAYSGISQASAMAAIPAPMAGHHYSVGMGSGFYAGQQAIAFGGKADVGEHIRLSAAMGTGMGSTSQMSANAGAGFSW
ncbi:MAG: YadA-like family protein [Methylococcales bacterium]|nr:YadA-like family protein [Methylococcales bacterium]